MRSCLNLTECLFSSVYDALTGEVVRENKGHKTCVRDVSWHPHHPEMISSSVRDGMDLYHLFFSLSPPHTN